MNIWKAHYLKLLHGRKIDEYWRTITNADDVNNAMKLAEKYARKGYICCKVVSE